MTSKNWLDFGDDPNHGRLGLGLWIQVAWRRFALSECFLVLLT